MQKTYFKLGDPDFNSSNDEYKQFEIGSTNGANLAINMGGAVISNNATPEDPNPTEKSILINGEPISGGSGNQIIDMWVETDEATENYYLNSHTTYEDISTMLSEGVIPTLHITVDPETYEGPYVIVDGVGVLDNTYAQFSGAHYAADAETGDIVDEHAYSFSLMWATDVGAGSFTVHKFLITSTNEYHVIEYNPNN